MSNDPDERQYTLAIAAEIRREVDEGSGDEANVSIDDSEAHLFARLCLDLAAEQDAARLSSDELRDQLAAAMPVVEGFAALHDRKAEWSIETFGPGNRYTGVVAHIRKELIEIEAEPTDLTEWCDVILLAMDGAMRACGATGAQLLAAMQAKQAKNEKRAWPDWRTLKPGEVSEHVRADTLAASKAGR